MVHSAIQQIEKRTESALQDSDFTYFFSLLLQGEALLKTTVLGFLSALVPDDDRHRYRLEHKVLKADGLGPWSMALEDAVSGPASQFLLTDFSTEKNELTRLSGLGTWQFDAVRLLKQTLADLQIEAEDVPSQTDMKRWFSLFAILRNKTRGHGATVPGSFANAAQLLKKSIDCFHQNHALFSRQWAYLYRNLSGKYKVIPITERAPDFDRLKSESDKSFPNGVYLFAGTPRLVPFMESDADLTDFFFPNGSFGKGTYELLSYASGNRKEGDASSHLTPPGALPPSETQGHGELQQLGNCFSNAPTAAKDYVSRPSLEQEVKALIQNDRHPVITLLGRGGIGKTSVALEVLHQVSESNQFSVLLWFSARDVDLQFDGPRPVQPHVMTPEAVSQFYVTLVAPDRMKQSGFRCREFFESQLQKNEVGPCLYVFDNFETTKNPEELFAWIDTHVRLPNKVLITTRLRDFKGDYPVEVKGMADKEARKLIQSTGEQLKITHLLEEQYVAELIKQADGHPYVMKILLGDVARDRRARHIERMVAGRDDILTALFERTYSSLTPCAQRAFMTLAAWNSAVPRVALEAVLHKSVGDVAEVERAVEMLQQYSLADRQDSVENMEFIILPLEALIFGRKKLAISPSQAAIRADAELLQMLGAVNRGEVHFSLAKRIESFVGRIARRIEAGESFEQYAPILEMIARNFPRAWLSVARLHMEEGTAAGYEKQKRALRLYLENDSTSPLAADAWRDLAHCCYNTHDLLGDIHAFVQRSKIASVPFSDLTSTARLFNDFLRKNLLEAGFDEKRDLARDLLVVLKQRRSEARADDFGQMAWLALRLGGNDEASEFVRLGLELEPENTNLQRLAKEPSIKL